MKPTLYRTGHSTGKQPKACPARLSTLAVAALLTACSNIPLPPWGSGAATVQPMSTPTPAQPPAVGTVRTTPLPHAAEATLPKQPPTTPAALSEPLPYSDAVAARFPDPDVRYDTPGLAADRSHFTSQEELAQWLRALANESLGQDSLIGRITAGTSQRGETIEALVATRARSIAPKALDALNRPTILLVGQQRGNEPVSGEALLIVARELSTGGLLEPLLERINVVIVPRANPDGALSGQASTANGVDLAHDHLQLRTPEAQALAALVRDYRPAVVIDVGEFPAIAPVWEKFPGLPRHDVLLQMASTPNVHEFITKATREWLHAPVKTALDGAQLSSDWYATAGDEMPAYRLSMEAPFPDNLQNVSALRNALSMSIRSRGGPIGRLHLQRRVHSQVIALNSALRSAAERTTELRQVQSFVRRDIAAQACRNQLLVQAALAPEQRTITLLDPTSGSDLQVKVDWDSSLALRPLAKRARPCGYWLSSTASVAAARLEQLGVQVLRVAETGPLIAETFTVTPGHAVATTTGIPRQIHVTPTRGGVDSAPGSFYVPMGQSQAHLASAALEPDTPYSFFAHHVVGNLESVARVMGKPSLVFEETDDD